MAADAQGQTRRAFVQVPANWDGMSPEEQGEAGLEMARDLQRQLGIEPNA